MSKFSLNNTLFQAEYSESIGGTDDTNTIKEVDRGNFGGANFKADGNLEFCFEDGNTNLYAEDITEFTLGSNTYVKGVDFDTIQEGYDDYIKPFAISLLNLAS